MAEEVEYSEVYGSAADQNPNSVEAKIESLSNTGSSSNNAESSVVTADGEREKSLEFADVLMERGSKASKEGDYSEAADCFSRALEIRAAHFGELAPECVNAYYKYGCALLYKAQEEADPLASMPKNEGASEEGSNKDGFTSASVSKNAEQDRGTTCSEDSPDKTVEGKGEEDEEGEDESDAEELADGDEDESDLDLAWKMLDVARAIVEKHTGDTMEKVDILSSLAEVALEREDVETSLSDYLKALSILEHLVEPDSRRLAELYFRICLCLEIGSKPEEAIPYCQKAISICKFRLQWLTSEVKNFLVTAERPTASESTETVQPSSTTSVSGDSLADKEADIETLTGLCSELEKKLEDLQQLVSNPTSILSDILGMMSTKARATEKNAISAAMSSSQIGTARTGGSSESPTVSTAHTNGSSGVTHLGVVGRGVKRVVISTTGESNPAKKPAVDRSSEDAAGSNS